MMKFLMEHHSLFGVMTVTIFYFAVGWSIYAVSRLGKEKKNEE
ncbi:hypothetical protein [Alkalicoccobacillus murimartini]|uniref:Cbb3-type cytochrome oxidase subunit 3 n=1 Tax=Alkalicoccobacillus murimartini TaxID=171685 RepID=A0ABT9YL55_9BACI|nr:hypothetical protein [Alkalicoccobacillus murimartini]MDQ0208592.1 cbb3-type cytochrome oxidase subunit 3 [Alkalicoccobacillus murimartini]